jgi:hypothetical protein
MKLTDELKTYILDTAKTLKGSTLRLFKARTVAQLGPGGQRLAERELGWNRVTLRKGQHELSSGFVCVDAFRLRGRKRCTELLPHLEEDIRSLLDGQSQADPQFRSQRLYTRLSAAEVRRQLIAKKGYTHAQLPAESTLSALLRRLGYYPRRVQKTRPQKKSLRPMPSSST